MSNLVSLKSLNVTKAFAIGDTVTIIPTGVKGIVHAVLESKSGVEYRVRCFDSSGMPQDVWFHPNEIVKVVA